MALQMQREWRWCSKCQGLWYGGNPAGPCPAGGSHIKTGSGNYSLVLDSASPAGQTDWRWCSKCQGLWYGGNPPGPCPAGANHIKAGSGEYRINMAVPQLTSNDFVIDSNAATAMAAVAFNGVPFVTILTNAMARLLGDIGQPLLNEANTLVSANGPTAQYPFSTADMERLLRDGNYKYNVHPPLPQPQPGVVLITIPSPRLTILGPEADMLGTTINARAPINGDLIRIHFQRFVAFANSDPATFPLNAHGMTCLEVIVAKTVLHEIMHNHGFRHPNRSTAPATYTPSDSYWRTLPEVAEQAYFRLYQGLFPGFTTILNLTTHVSNLGVCGTNN